MSKISSTAYYHKFLLKIGLTVMAGFIGQTALAACPDTEDINITDPANRVGTANGSSVYFCKQIFPNSSLIFAPTERQLLNGGSQAISRGNTIQSFPLSNRVDLMGFNVANLAFNQLSANFPNTNGAFGSPSLFNFYIRSSDRNDDCKGEYQTIKSFLRNNPNVFQLNPSFSSIAQDATSNTSIVKVKDAKLKSTMDPTKDLIANIDLYYANPTEGQYFTGGTIFNRYRDCWFGVGTRVTLNPNNSDLEYAGSYDLQIGVLTQ